MRYNNLKLGKAIAINTIAGVIVQISSINVNSTLNISNTIVIVVQGRTLSLPL
jgi:hypothetical protein